MKFVKVEYQVRPDYVATNQQNIRTVMAALRAKKITSFWYSSYYLGDGKFMHTNLTVGDDFTELNELPEFKDFLAALKESGPLVPPKLTDMELVGANMDLI